jgi:chemotaxis protein MotB
MSEDKNKRPIVIKRIKNVAGGSHGGAWKIAYADFVTAMMAFFLLMWLLGSTAKGDLAGISEYFKTPLKVALMGGSGSGDSSSIIKGGGRDLTRSEGQVKAGDQTNDRKVINTKAAQEEFLRKEREKEANKLKELKSSIEKSIENNAITRFCSISPAKVCAFKSWMIKIVRCFKAAVRNSSPTPGKYCMRLVRR